MARPKTRDVHCLDCGKVFPSAVKNPQCNCGSRNVSEAGFATQEEAMEKGRRRRKDAQMPIQPLPFVVDSDTYIKMQTLMNYGMGKNYDEVIKKCIDNMLVMRTGLVKGGGNMSDSEETLEGIKKRELLDAEKRRIEADVDEKRRGSSPTEKIRRLSEDELDRRMAEAQLKKLESGSQSPIEQMMMMEYFKSLRGGRNGNSEVEELKRKLELMEQEKRFDDIRKSNEDLKSLVMDVLKSKTGDTQESLITKMTQIFADRDKDMSRLQQEIQSAREETRQAQLDAKLSKIEEKFQQLSGGKSEIQQFKDTFSTVKELAQELGGKKPEKSGAELAQELITSTIDKIQEPVLKPLGQALADRVSRQQETISNPAALQNYRPENIDSEPEIQIPQEEYSDLVQVSKE